MHQTLVKTSLYDCISRHIATLGPSFENLGKSIGSGLLGRRTLLLSYNATAGWELLQLNIFQLFLRNYLGFYTSTHFTPIAKAWSKNVYKPFLDNAFTSRILDIWQKKHLAAYGNSQLDNAEVICFGEKHDSKIWVETNWHLIKKLYKPGDVILIEGKTRRKTKTTSDGLIVQGWEPPESEKTIPQSLVKFNEMCAQLQDLYKNATTHLFQNSTPTKTEAEELMREFKEVHSYFEGKRDVLDYIYSNATDYKKIIGMIWYSCLEILQSNLKKIGFKQITLEEEKQIEEGLEKRDESLCQEIEHARSQGKRVLLIAGIAHLFQFPNSARIDNVKEILRKYRFTCLIKQSHFTKKRLAALNSDLHRL